jgi:hypothetical protein
MGNHWARCPGVKERESVLQGASRWNGKRWNGGAEEKGSVCALRIALKALRALEDALQGIYTSRR